MTVREIAKQAGVSPATVSRYLSGSGKVSRTASEKIRNILEASGCQFAPRTKQKNNLIGVLIPNLECRFFNEVLSEIIKQITNYGFQIVFIPTVGGNKENFRSLVSELKLGGLIFLDENIEADILRITEELRLKTVICGAAAIGSQAAMVHINDLAAAYEGTKYLIGLGHRKIAFLSDFPYSISSGFQRLAGCRKAMEEAGLEFDEQLVRCGDVVYESGYRFTRELLQNKVQFTAIFAFSDEMANGAMNALYDEGLSVPEDISVLGFDDLTLASRIRPALTTIHQPLSEMVKNTLDILANPNTNMTNIAITLPYSVCERASCRKIEE